MLRKQNWSTRAIPRVWNVKRPHNQHQVQIRSWPVSSRRKWRGCRETPQPSRSSAAVKLYNFETLQLWNFFVHTYLFSLDCRSLFSISFCSQPMLATLMESTQFSWSWMPSQERLRSTSQQVWKPGSRTTMLCVGSPSSLLLRAWLAQSRWNIFSLLLIECSLWNSLMVQLDSGNQALDHLCNDDTRKLPLTALRQGQWSQET